MENLHEKVFSQDGDYSLSRLLMSKMHRLRQMWALFTPEPPFNRSDLMFLGTICRESRGGKEVTVSSLAKEFHQSLAAASQKVSWLEQKGFIERITSSKDKRVTCIEPTPAGLEFSLHNLEKIFRKLDIVIEKAGRENIRQLVDLLDKLLTIVEEEQAANRNEKHNL